MWIRAEQNQRRLEALFMLKWHLLVHCVSHCQVAGSQWLAGCGPSESSAARMGRMGSLCIEGRVSAGCSQHGTGTGPQGPHSRGASALTKPHFSEPAAEFWACPCAPCKERGCAHQGECHHSLPPPALYVLCVKPTVSRFPVRLVKPGLWALPGQLIFCGTQGATKPKKPCFSFFNYIHCGSRDKVGITKIIWSNVVWAEFFCVYYQCGMMQTTEELEQTGESGFLHVPQRQRGAVSHCVHRGESASQNCWH